MHGCAGRGGHTSPRMRRHLETTLSSTRCLGFERGLGRDAWENLPRATRLARGRAQVLTAARACRWYSALLSSAPDGSFSQRERGGGRHSHGNNCTGEPGIMWTPTCLQTSPFRAGPPRGAPALHWASLRPPCPAEARCRRHLCLVTMFPVSCHSVSLRCYIFYGITCNLDLGWSASLMAVAPLPVLSDPHLPHPGVRLLPRSQTRRLAPCSPWL